MCRSRRDHIKELVGHASIATTEAYVNARCAHLHESLGRIEAKNSGKRCGNDRWVVASQTTDQGADNDRRSLVN